MATIATITGNIGDHTKSEHNCSVILKGSVGRNSYLKINGGGLLITGDVGDNTEIIVEGVQTSAGRRVLIDGLPTGTIISEDFAKAGTGPQHLTIQGKIGNNVTIRCGTSVYFQSAGKNLNIKSGDCIDSSNLAPEESTLKAKNRVACLEL